MSFCRFCIIRYICNDTQPIRKLDCKTTVNPPFPKHNQSESILLPLLNYFSELFVLICVNLLNTQPQGRFPAWRPRCPWRALHYYAMFCAGKCIFLSRRSLLSQINQILSACVITLTTVKSLFNIRCFNQPQTSTLTH